MEGHKGSLVHGRGVQSDLVPQLCGLNAREADGDRRDQMAALDRPPVKLRTTVTEQHPKTILSFNQSPDTRSTEQSKPIAGATNSTTFV